jgi:chromosome condensin MukBEF MukE localization factor
MARPVPQTLFLLAYVPERLAYEGRFGLYSTYDELA